MKINPQTLMHGIKELNNKSKELTIINLLEELQLPNTINNRQLIRFRLKKIGLTYQNERRGRRPKKKKSVWTNLLTDVKRTIKEAEK